MVGIVLAGWRFVWRSTHLAHVVSLIQLWFMAYAGRDSAPMVLSVKCQQQKASRKEMAGDEEALKDEAATRAAKRTKLEKGWPFYEPRDSKEEEYTRIVSLEDGSAEAAVLELATSYAADGQLDWEAWRALIGDLLCLRDGTLTSSDDAIDSAARAIGRACQESECRKLSTEQLVAVAHSWSRTLALVASSLGGRPRLPQLLDPTLPERLRELKRLREAASAWVFAIGVYVDRPVEEWILRSERGWRFVDHGDGEGIVYYWPKQRAATDSFSAFPVRKAVLDDDTAKVEARLAREGDRAIDCGGDGDCFFKVLAYQLFGPDHLDQHRWLRARTVEYMRSKPEVYEATAAGLAPTFDAYCDAMAREGTYVEGDAEILAAAARFDVVFDIAGIDTDHDALVAPPQISPTTRTVKMVHYAHRQHYCAVQSQHTAHEAVSPEPPPVASPVSLSAPMPKRLSSEHFVVTTPELDREPPPPAPSSSSSSPASAASSSPAPVTKKDVLPLSTTSSRHNCIR